MITYDLDFKQDDVFAHGVATISNEEDLMDDRKNPEEYHKNGVEYMHSYSNQDTSQGENQGDIDEYEVLKYGILSNSNS